MVGLHLLAGRLGRIDLNTQNHPSVCALTVSEIRNIRNEEGEWEKTTIWHPMTAWGKLAERVAGGLHEGSLCLFHYRIDYIKGSSSPTLKLIGFDGLGDGRKEEKS